MFCVSSAVGQPFHDGLERGGGTIRVTVTPIDPSPCPGVSGIISSASIWRKFGELCCCGGVVVVLWWCCGGVVVVVWCWWWCHFCHRVWPSWWLVIPLALVTPRVITERREGVRVCVCVCVCLWMCFYVRTRVFKLHIKMRWHRFMILLNITNY